MMFGVTLMATDDLESAFEFVEFYVLYIYIPDMNLPFQHHC
jgi:hypothetical protein